MILSVNNKLLNTNIIFEPKLFGPAELISELLAPPLFSGFFFPKYYTHYTKNDI